MIARDRRAIVVGVLAIAACILVLRVVPWFVRGVRGMHARAAEASLAAARAREVLAATPATRDSLAAALAAVVQLAPRLLEGRSAAEATAGLTGQINVAAHGSAVRVVRVDPLPDSGAVFARAAVRLEAEGDAGGLARFLARIERGTVLLTVPALAVTSAAPAARSEALRFEATVEGLFLRSSR